ncbi:hypothetical protein KC967_02415 [Candidatus Saccharibacteria bacterium]|nr:hypothetical protein [Candidatus Saccharibacteria bacterium]
MARRILGSAADELTDTQVKEMLITFKLLGNEQLLYNGSKVNESSNEYSNHITEA